MSIEYEVRNLNKSGPIGYGLFFGYQANLGSSEENFFLLVDKDNKPTHTRSANIDNILRVSPRISFTSGKLMFGIEYMMTTATYGSLKADTYEFDTESDPTMNNRIHISAKYTF
jgi:hypothetical protein